MQRVLQGDSAVILREFDDNYFHAIVTDPPHALGKKQKRGTAPGEGKASGFMSADWDKHLPPQAIFDECYRVLKPGGHIWIIANERWATCFGLGMRLRNAGFLIDDSQIVAWLSLTGMPKSHDISKQADKQAFRRWLEYVGRETVKCPNHHAENDENGKPKRCAACAKVFAEGKITQEERRKAESAAVNGKFDVTAWGRPAHGARGITYSTEAFGANPDRSAGTALLSFIISSHWPSSPAEQRAQWEAVVGEVPEGWDTSRPPGVRVQVAEKTVSGYPDGKGVAHYKNRRKSEGSQVWTEGTVSITRPSTPIAAEWDGWRGSITPFRPLVSLILHAQKPWKGSYLRCAEEHGTGSINVDGGKIPFGEGGEYTVNVLAEWSGLGQLKRPDYEAREETVGRVPGNILTYADLLGELTHQADLDMWAKRFGLPTPSAELLETGIVYCPKPSRREKQAGLDANEGVAVYNRKCRKCGKWERSQGLDAERYTCRCASPEWIEPKGNVHPTCKPVALSAFLIGISTKEGDNVLDPFVGSGTTLVAAKMLGRNGVGIELSEEYAEIARARLSVTNKIQEFS